MTLCIIFSENSHLWEAKKRNSLRFVSKYCYPWLITVENSLKVATNGVSTLCVNTLLKVFKNWTRDIFIYSPNCILNFHFQFFHGNQMVLINIIFRKPYKQKICWTQIWTSWRLNTEFPHKCHCCFEYVGSTLCNHTLFSTRWIQGCVNFETPSITAFKWWPFVVAKHIFLNTNIIHFS